MPDCEALTAANIRYLLVLLELDSDGTGAKGADIARRLQVSKPSVHTMIAALCKRGCASKERYGAVHLTISGRLLAERYANCYNLLYRQMEQSLLLETEDCKKVACAVLAEMKDAEMNAMIQRLKQISSISDRSAEK